MQPRSSQLTVCSLAGAVVALIAISALLALEFAGKDISVELFIAFAVVAVVSGTGLVGVACVSVINRHTDDKHEQLAQQHEELRNAIAELVTSIEEYGDQRATNARIETLRQIGHDGDAEPSAGTVSQIRPQRRPHVGSYSG